MDPVCFFATFSDNPRVPVVIRPTWACSETKQETEIPLQRDTLVELMTWGHTDPQRNHIPFPKIKNTDFFSQGRILLNWLLDEDTTWVMALELNESRGGGQRIEPVQA